MTACASGSASKAELGELRAELRALREGNARLAQQLERLEMRDAVGRARNASPSAAEGPAAVAPPSLTVVKLKPKAEPAPKLPTEVPVVEPLLEQVEAFSAPSPPAVEEELAKDPAVLDVEFEQGVSALRTGNVTGGVSRLTRFSEDNPRHPRADNALYFAGLGLIGLQEYEAAAAAFEQLISRYPAGDTMLDGMLRLAECRMRLNQMNDARALYTRVLTQFPGTAAATQAEQRLASLSQ